jgi:hypothetical protein
MLQDDVPQIEYRRAHVARPRSRLAPLALWISIISFPLVWGPLAPNALRRRINIWGSGTLLPVMISVSAASLVVAIGVVVWLHAFRKDEQGRPSAWAATVISLTGLLLTYAFHLMGDFRLGPGD